MPPNDNHNGTFAWRSDGISVSSSVFTLGIVRRLRGVPRRMADSSLRFCKRSALLRAIHVATTVAHVVFQHARPNVNAHRSTSFTLKHVRCTFGLPRSHIKLRTV